jgi:hypothetical protein
MADKSYELSEDGASLVETTTVVRTISRAELEQRSSQLAWQLEQLQREIADVEAQLATQAQLVAASQAPPSPPVEVKP